MDIGAIGKMLGMARGQESLGQEGGQEGSHGADQQRGKIDPELLKKLMEMLSGGAGGAQGGGGSSGSSGSDGSAGQPDSEAINKMMAGRQGMEAMMPDSDNGRQIQA